MSSSASISSGMSRRSCKMSFFFIASSPKARSGAYNARCCQIIFSEDPRIQQLKDQVFQIFVHFAAAIALEARLEALHDFGGPADPAVHVHADKDVFLVRQETTSWVVRG